MKWFTFFLLAFIALQSAQAQTALVNTPIGAVAPLQAPSLIDGMAIVNSSREGTASFLVMMPNAANFQNPTTGQLMAMMRMDPRTSPLLQYLNLAVPSGGSYRSITVDSLPRYSAATSVRVSTNENNSPKVERLSEIYNRLSDSKIASASKVAAEKDRTKAANEFAEGLKACQKEIKNPKYGLDEKDVMSNWMFLRRRLEMVSPECKAGILASGGSDLSSNKAVENRPGEIKGSREFTMSHYGTTTSTRSSGAR